MKIRKPIEFYINQAKIKHNNKYDYSLIKPTDKPAKNVDIICPIHGKFTQRLDHHITSPHGCKQCSNFGRKTQEKFIEEAKLVHGDKYDYSLVKYVNTSTNVKIICKEHGEFSQSPTGHLSHSGCQKCSGHHLFTIEDFIEKSINKHGNIYDYSLVNYVNNSTKVKIICKEHGIFEQVPQSHFVGSGCPKCGEINRGKNNPRKHNTEWFIKESENVHNNRYDYSLSEYKRFHGKITIICKIHGQFKQSAGKHIFEKQGCPRCAGTMKRTTEEFIRESKKIHGETYDYSLVDYQNKETPVKIICKNHGIFEQVPHNHLWAEHGCPSCCRGQSSKIEHEWLDYIGIIETQRNLNIKINGRLFKIDGFDSKTNTIYEFYGDFYHGNPKFYNPLEENPVNGKTYGELYTKTMEREFLLKNAGYNLITIWENDYIKLRDSNN